MKSTHSLFSRHRTSSVERELSRTPYAFTAKLRDDDDSLDTTSLEEIRSAKERILDPFEDDINVRLAKERLFGGYSRPRSRVPSPTIFPSNDDFDRKLKKIESDVENDLFGQNISFDALSNISERLSETSSVKNFDHRTEEPENVLELEKRLVQLPPKRLSLLNDLPPRPKIPKFSEKPPLRKFSDLSRTSSEKVIKTRPDRDFEENFWKSEVPDISSKKNTNLNTPISDQNKNPAVVRKRKIQRRKTADSSHIKRLSLARSSQDSFNRSTDNSETPQKADIKNNYQQNTPLTELYTERYHKSIQSGSSGDSDNYPNHSEVVDHRASEISLPDGAFKVIAPPAPPSIDSSVPSEVSSYKLQPTTKAHRNTAFAILGEPPPSTLPILQVAPPSSIDTASNASLTALSGRVSPFRGKGFKADPNSRHTTPVPSRDPSPPSRSRADSFNRSEIIAKVQSRFSYDRSPTPNRNYIKENIIEVKELSEFNREKNMLLAEQKRIDEEIEMLKELGVLDNKGLLKHGADLEELCSRAASPGVLNSSSSNIPKLNFNEVDIALGKSVSPRVNFQKIAKSQPQSKTGSPLHSSRIPTSTQVQFLPLKEKAKSNLSPSKMSNRINPGGRFISNSTGSISDKRVFSVIPGDQDSNDETLEPTSQKTRGRSNQAAKGKSPGRLGPPPTRGGINSKRLSPIESTPDKSPSSTRSRQLADSRSRTPSSKTPGGPGQANKLRGTKSLATSPNTSRVPSRAGKRIDPKETPIKKGASTSNVNNDPRGRSRPTMKSGYGKSNNSIDSSDTEGKPALRRINSRSSITSSIESNKPELRRMNSKTSLLNAGKQSRKSSITSASEKVILFRRKPSLKNLQEKSGEEAAGKGKNKKGKNTRDQEDDTNSIPKQDNETQYDKMSQLDLSMDKLIPLTKGNVVSMTTAAITAQPLEIAAKVTSQLPSTFEKAREKALFDRNSSSDSIAAKPTEVKEGDEESKDALNKLQKMASKASLMSIKEEKGNMIINDNVKLKPLSDSQLDPKVEKVKRKIDNILKSTSSSEVDLRDKANVDDKNSADKVKKTLEKVTEKVEDLSKKPEASASDKSKEQTDGEKRIDSATSRSTEQVRKAISKKIIEEVKKNAPKEKDVFSVASNALMNGKSAKSATDSPKPKPKPEPVPSPKVDAVVKKEEILKKDIPTPPVAVVNQRPSGVSEPEEITEQIVRGDPDVEVQSGNTSMSIVSDKKDQNFNDTYPKIQPIKEKGKMQEKTEIGESSKQGLVTGTSNGAGNSSKLPQSESKVSESIKAPGKGSDNTPIASSSDVNEDEGKTKSGCGKFFGGLTAKLPFKRKPKDATQVEVVNEKTKKKSTTSLDAEKKNTGKSRLNCFSKKEVDEPNISIVPKTEMAQNNPDEEKSRWSSCICCRGKNKVRDSSQGLRETTAVESKRGWRSLACCCKSQEQKDQEWAARRDSILSQSQPPKWWQKVLCCKKGGDSMEASRRTSLFSKKRSLSQAVPLEHKYKLDVSMVEHNSLIRGAIPALPIPLAWICFMCNILVPGLGTICSGMFCMCFGVPRFGVNDGWKPRIGAFLIDLIVGVGQLFTVLFCLVGWGWSIWWATIMIKVARKYKKMKEAAELEPPPATNNNRISHA